MNLLHLEQAFKDFIRQLYSFFKENSKKWQLIINILAELDCLCSLSKVSFDRDIDFSMSRPKFIFSEIPYLNAKEIVHPCLVKNGIKFNPLSINFNTKKLNNPETILLTGPNMGGKSTTLRTLGIMAILAHIGCYVPAKSCELTLIDNIYTRMGSQETLCEGKSSFYIELEETLNILCHAKMKSLILFDELGKGTSTFDGVAIAYSVIKHIIEEIKCRTIFTTHYHLLTKEFELDQRLVLYHMAFHHDSNTNNIFFEYQLKEGASNKSHGISLAKCVFEMAGLTDKIIEKAIEICEEFEKCDEKFKKILKLF